MGSITVTLTRGLLVGDEAQLEAELREPTAGDVIDAGQEAERVVMTAEGPELVSSPSLLGALVLCKQVVRIGTVQGPLKLADLKKLSALDLQRLQEKAQELEAAALRVDAAGAI